MKTFFSKRIRVWLLVAVVMLIALGTIGAGASSASAAGPLVPFKASVSGTVVPPDLSGAFALIDGTGTASHLGKVSYKAVGQITGATTDTLTETFTAANGDTLTILCNQVLEDLGGGVLRGTDTWTVIGGTGRFSGASGSGTGVTYVYNLSTFTKELTGTISYSE